jgi:hypothetical protein
MEAWSLLEFIILVGKNVKLKQDMKIKVLKATVFLIGSMVVSALMFRFKTFEN